MTASNNTPNGAGAANSDLLTRRQAAAYLGIAEQTLAVWKCTGRYHLPWIKIGRLVRYRKQDLDAFIARHAEGTEHPAFMFRDIANGRAIGGQQ
ncbi:MAG: helix-turn-helix domain-containing protein [Candidatus Melainabacteria bacterium]|nr:helix-turn-helix domain-containing protein [Candidatus Melainabacteria bacterium]